MDLITLTGLAEDKLYVDIVAVFARHHTLFDDNDLFDTANDHLFTE